MEAGREPLVRLGDSSAAKTTRMGDSEIGVLRRWCVHGAKASHLIKRMSSNQTVYTPTAENDIYLTSLEYEQEISLNLKAGRVYKFELRDDDFETRIDRVYRMNGMRKVWYTNRYYYDEKILLIQS